MALVAVALGLILLVGPGLVAPRCRRLPPPQWARWAAASVAVGLALVDLGALLAASPTVLQAAGVPKLASLCQRAVGSLVVWSPAVGWAAAVVAVTVAGRAAHGWRRGRRVHRLARAEPWLGTHHRLDDHDLVVLPTARPVAFSVAGQPGQVVVSSGLWATLDPAEFEVLIAHEVAHLDFGHQRLLTVALVAERAIGWLPGVSRSLSSLRLGVERWADEEAAGRHPTRRRALQTALLAAAGTPAGALAAFGRVDGLVERIDALDRPAPVGSPAGAALLGTPAAAAALAGFGALGSWMGHAGVVLAMAVHCSA